MEYQCRDGSRCISVSQQCDGNADCNDADDEEHCEGSEYQTTGNEADCVLDQSRYTMTDSHTHDHIHIHTVHID